MNLRTYCILILAFLGFQGYAQVAFEEDFEDLATGLDLTTEGYVLSQGESYTGTVTALVTEGDGNRFARMVASPNGAAKMQIAKTVDVEPGKVYAYEVESRGPFKRWLRIFSMDGELLSTSPDYKPATEAEQTAWYRMSISFMPGPGVEKVRIAFYHYWSGTIDLDNFRVEEVESQGAYYVSSSAGDDENPGTLEEPWQSLAKISSTSLLPGDSVLFKRGDTLRGQFIVNGSGFEGNPILISAFGEGPKPVLSGQVGEAGGGDYREAILVLNQDNLVFEELDVQNERLVTREGVSDTDAYGMTVQNNGTRVMRNLVFRDMDFRNVFAVEPMLNPEDFDKIQVAALYFGTSKNTVAGQEKHIRDILVEHCYFANNQRFGIRFSHSGGNAGIGNDSINRNMNILIRNNEFYYNGGTGVLPNGTYNCLIENNIFDHPGASTDPRMPGRGSSIWNINCINTIIQYNMCLSTRGYLDSYGIHIDLRNENTFVQYNYMDDCEGGFVEILPGNKNAVYRFNVSVNSGWRQNPTWENSNSSIWMNADRWGDPEDFNPGDSLFVYNNTVVVDKPFTTVVSMDGKHIHVYNNIWTSTNGAGVGEQNVRLWTNGTPHFISNNLFEGTVAQDFINLDANPFIGEAGFDSVGIDENQYHLQYNSLALDNGAPRRGPVVKGAGYGVFKDITAYPEVDFFGNPIDLSAGTPNIGACNLKYNVEENTEVFRDTSYVGDTIFSETTSITCKTITRIEGGMALDPVISCDTTVFRDTAVIGDTIFIGSDTLWINKLIFTSDTTQSHDTMFVKHMRIEVDTAIVSDTFEIVGFNRFVVMDTLVWRDTTVSWQYIYNPVGVDPGPPKESPWLVYPQMKYSRILIRNENGIRGPTLISLINLRGQEVQRSELKGLTGEREIYLPVDPGLENGIYFLHIRGSLDSHSRRIILLR